MFVKALYYHYRNLVVRHTGPCLVFWLPLAHSNCTFGDGQELKEAGLLIQVHPRIRTIVKNHVVLHAPDQRRAGSTWTKTQRLTHGKPSQFLSFTSLFYIKSDEF
jgi:hypothetical protein